MSISPERAQELQEQYQELKETILDIDKKYALNYQEPQLDLPPTLGLQPLEFVPKTEEELRALASADVTPNHQNKLRNFEQSYLRQKQSLEGKRFRLSESSRKKLAQLLDDYNADIKKLRRRLINNGLIFSSVVTQANDNALVEYNNKVSNTVTHYDNLIGQVDTDLAELENRYTQGLNSLDDELALRINEQYQDLLYRQEKDAERIEKYNKSLSEKETKYQASCQKALEYARQAEWDRALKAAALYAELGESGVESQNVSEKYHYCKQFFTGWLREEALLVVADDTFLIAHLGDYYNSLIDWINTALSPS
ncbi:MAG: hypothetical protein IKC58_05530 [Clostridia bacterium]|nr:hypothetical protein [Clostridia bacterium]